MTQKVGVYLRIEDTVNLFGNNSGDKEGRVSGWSSWVSTRRPQENLSRLGEPGPEVLDESMEPHTGNKQLQINTNWLA